MQEIDPTYEQSGDDTGSDSPRNWRRLLILSCTALVVVLLVLLPPLISVNRFQRRIATSISESLGRPVHLDKVSLNLLPLPGFTLENFVVSEDPEFGSEPIIRANSVKATLRISSLWRKRVEFSTISFTEPSVNLVHARTGKWNIESILVHAAHIDAAPTAQKSAGAAPRFPYIEATGARLNLKLDDEKTPMSLTDAEFALWLPDTQAFHLRLQARPVRTDTSVSDTGLLEVEGTLGRAASMAQVPISLRGEWSKAPLGEASRMLFGHDAGLRGEMTLSATAQGTVGSSKLQARLRLNDARRAEFVPEKTLSVDMQCLATATGAFHGLEDVRCNWPPAGSSDAPLLKITGALPDIHRPGMATARIAAPGLPAATLLEWLHVASARVPADISAKGTLTWDLSWRLGASGSGLGWTGGMLMKDAGLINPRGGAESLVSGDVSLQSVGGAAAEVAETRRGKRVTPAPAASADGFVLAPVELALGGREPATLEGRFDARGYTLHLTGMASSARMLALGAALPLFGDGLAAVLPTNRAAGPYRVDLTATRPWGGAQVWTDGTVRAPAPRVTRRGRR